MDKKLFKIGFVVENVEKEAEFFIQVFDMKLQERLHTPDGDYILLRAGEMTIELLPHKLNPACALGFHHICFKTADVGRALHEVKEKGAVVRANPFDAGFGITLADIDGPEGTLIRLFRREQ